MYSTVEALDTALRRRFSFTEMMPKPSLLESVAGVDLPTMLATINKRLEVLVGRDHTIGHAFFMGVNNLDDLKKVFRDKVIPQLQEYFYGDWQKIQLILGKSFVLSKNPGHNIFAVPDDGDYDDRPLWSVTSSDFWTAAAFQSIYKKTQTEQAGQSSGEANE